MILQDILQQPETGHICSALSFFKLVVWELKSIISYSFYHIKQSVSRSHISFVPDQPNITVFNFYYNLATLFVLFSYLTLLIVGF